VRPLTASNLSPILDDDRDHDDDDEGSGSGLMMISDDTHMDDEDYTPPPPAYQQQHVVNTHIEGNFECQYSKQQQPVQVRIRMIHLFDIAHKSRGFSVQNEY
jgi:hypothetical protein